MKLKDKVNPDELSAFNIEDEQESSFDAASASLLYEFLSGNIYSNKISSICRELISNAYDANLEVNNQKHPIIVNVDYELEDQLWYFTVRDFGPGISDERFKKVYLKWLASTKRDSNKFIGCKGIGSKSPFSYTDEFEIVTYIDGVKTTYSYVKDKKPKLYKLIEEETSEPNGTLIKVPLEPGDSEKFKEASITQAGFFLSVWFKFLDKDSNAYDIIDTKYFQWRPDFLPYSEKAACIKFGNVIYPIDWGVLGRRRIELPIAIKFDIGDFDVNLSREAIVYDDETIEVINQRLDETLQWLDNIEKVVTKLTEEEVVDRMKNGETLVDLSEVAYYNIPNDKNYKLYVEGGEKEFYIVKDSFFTLKELNHFLNELSDVLCTPISKKGNPLSYNSNVNLFELKRKENKLLLFLQKGDKKDTINTEHWLREADSYDFDGYRHKKAAFFIATAPSFSTFKREMKYQIRHRRNPYRINLIKEVYRLWKTYVVPEYDNIQNYKEFSSEEVRRKLKEKRGNTVAKKKTAEEVSVYTAHSSRLQLKRVLSTYKTIFYVTRSFDQKNEKTFSFWQTIFNWFQLPYRKIGFIGVSESNESKLTQFDNIHHISKFYETRAVFTQVRYLQILHKLIDIQKRDNLMCRSLLLPVLDVPSEVFNEHTKIYAQMQNFFDGEIEEIKTCVRNNGLKQGDLIKSIKYAVEKKKYVPPQVNLDFAGHLQRIDEYYSRYVKDVNQFNFVKKHYEIYKFLLFKYNKATKENYLRLLELLHRKQKQLGLMDRYKLIYANLKQ